MDKGLDIDLDAPTPVERYGDLWVKRDDLFEFAGMRGGKVRSCLHIASMAQSDGYVGLITAGSRHSPQVAIVSRIAQALKMKCRVHVPWGATTDEIEIAKNAGAEVITQKPGYNSVIVARCHTDALQHRDWVEVPFGMECYEAVNMTAEQVVNIPLEVKRIVMPVGSGMSACGVSKGLLSKHRSQTIVGVRVGADPIKRLDHFWPHWRKNMTLLTHYLPYDKHVKATIGDVVLDEVYEAKALSYCEPGDLLWIVGVRGIT